jgi:hypothetical protein
VTLRRERVSVSKELVSCADIPHPEAMRSVIRAAGATAISVAIGCASGESPTGAAAQGSGGHGGQAATSTHGSGGSFVQPDGGSDACGCTEGIQNDHILVLSDEGELWAFHPPDASFAFVTTLPCATSSPFSMAVAPNGLAWVLLSGSHDLVTLDVNAGTACAEPAFEPDQSGFGLFGMAFSADEAGKRCATLFAHSYDGSGPFGEGPGLGKLGRIDRETLELSEVGPIDFDGGELSGTGDARLFAFAGKEPAKLVEYDKATGAALSVLPLDGFQKTNASAFAFYGGDAFFFTEAPHEDCAPCLARSCAAEHEACAADPVCAEDLACALGQGDITDACGGTLSEALADCLFGPCAGACFPRPNEKVSQVHRLDYDESDGPGKALSLVVPNAPVRVVGAGSSICVPTGPPK